MNIGIKQLNFIKNKIKSQLDDIRSDIGELRYDLYIKMVDGCDDYYQLLEMAELELQIDYLNYTNNNIINKLEEENTTVKDLRQAIDSNGINSDRYLDEPIETDDAYETLENFNDMSNEEQDKFLDAVARNIQERLNNEPDEEKDRDYSEIPGMEVNDKLEEEYEDEQLARFISGDDNPEETDSDEDDNDEDNDDEDNDILGYDEDADYDSSDELDDDGGYNSEDEDLSDLLGENDEDESENEDDLGDSDGDALDNNEDDLDIDSDDDFFYAEDAEDDEETEDEEDVDAELEGLFDDDEGNDEEDSEDIDNEGIDDEDFFFDSVGDEDSTGDEDSAGLFGNEESEEMLEEELAGSDEDDEIDSDEDLSDLTDGDDDNEDLSDLTDGDDDNEDLSDLTDGEDDDEDLSDLTDGDDSEDLSDLTGDDDNEDELADLFGDSEDDGSNNDTDEDSDEDLEDLFVDEDNGGNPNYRPRGKDNIVDVPIVFGKGKKIFKDAKTQATFDILMSVTDKAGKGLQAATNSIIKGIDGGKTGKSKMGKGRN